MISKIILPIVILSVLVYIAVPSEWKQIYSLYNFSSQESDIIIPIPGITKNGIDDTYGAFRSYDRNHEGVDIFANRGAEVKSCCKGVVLYKGRDVYGGNTIRIFGEDNRIYYYAHLDRYADVDERDEIRQGEIIGFVGNTGNALETMPHLHFEIMEISWLFPLIKTNINPYNEFK